MEKKLERNTLDGALAGVCAGLGDYMEIDKTWIRVAFVVSIFLSGYGIGLLGPVAYIILWIVLPVKPLVFPRSKYDVDYRATTSPFDATPLSEEGATASSPFGQQGYKSTSKGTAYKPAPKKNNGDRTVAGIILLAIGFAFLFHQLDLFSWREISRYWPVILIFIGIATIGRAFDRPKAKYTEPLGTADTTGDPMTKPSPDDDSTSKHTDGDMDLK